MATPRGSAGRDADPTRQARPQAQNRVNAPPHAAAVMFHAALSARLGLSATEEKALDLLDRFGPLTARQLAERSGLAPASVTGLVRE
jgi:MarR family